MRLVYQKPTSKGEDDEDEDEDEEEKDEDEEDDGMEPVQTFLGSLTPGKVCYRKVTHFLVD